MKNIYLSKKKRYDKMPDYIRRALFRREGSDLCLGDLPSIINIEIMTVCNLKCRHCRVSYFGGPARGYPAMMKFDLFKEMVDRISPLVRYAQEFQLSTIEPLLHKRVFDMMDYVSAHNRRISYPLLSNGMLLNEKNIRQLCRRHVPYVEVSLDGCRKETVESFKTGADFNTIVRNIRLLKRVAGKKVAIYTVFVATTRNIGELVEYVHFCGDLGIDKIYINGFLCYKPGLSKLSLYSRKGNEGTRTIFLKAHEAARKAGIGIAFPSLTTKSQGCSLTSFLYIDEKGNVSPCMHLSRPTQLSLFSKTRMTHPVVYGNILRDDPVSLWFDNRYMTFRDTLKSSRVPRECVFCADAYGVICSNRRFVP